MLKNPSLLAIGLVLALLWGSCCQPCEKGFVGEFLLTTEEAEWIDFYRVSARTFVDANGNEDTYIYEPLVTNNEELADNCEFNGQCGTCCETYRAGTAYTFLLNANGTRRFDILLRKDFINYTPSDPVDSVGAYLTITYNNQLPGDIFDLPERELKGTITLNGRSFSRVYLREANPNNLPPRPEAPKAWYFTKADGIVGFELVNGDVWALK